MASKHSRITVGFTIRLIRMLREVGVSIGTQQTITCIQSIFLYEKVDSKQLMAIYTITLINRREDIFHLQRMFEILWQEYQQPRTSPEESLKEKEENEEVILKIQQYKGDNQKEDTEDLTEAEGYSTREVNYHKDFRLIPKEDISSVIVELNKIAQRYALIPRRKMKESKHSGKTDMRKSIRQSVKYGGEIISWKYKKKIPTHSRFVIVADVSGSMEVYSFFILNFLYLLHNHNRMKVDSFIFSTHLLHLTNHLRSKDFQRSLKNISLNFNGWSGGTKIGNAIETLNEIYSTVITPKTTVIIMSDGWDTGEMDLLEREMSRLRNRSKSIIWMNPLKGDSSYEPLAMGMATAYRYCDQLISCHNLDSLKQFAKLLSK